MRRKNKRAARVSVWITYELQNSIKKNCIRVFFYEKKTDIEKKNIAKKKYKRQKWLSKKSKENKKAWVIVHIYYKL